MTTQGRRSKRAEYSITEPIALDDLRWLVNQCVNLPGNSTVTVKEHKSHSPVDWDAESIKVSGEISED